MLEPYAAETALILRKPLFYLMHVHKTKKAMNSLHRLDTSPSAN